MKFICFALLLIQSSLTLAFPYEDLPDYEKNSANLWKGSYSHEIVPISNGDILIPVQTLAPTYTLSNPTEGVFDISTGGVSSVTRHPEELAFTICDRKDTFQYRGRPTLIVSIVGWAGQAPGQAPELAGWQESLKHKINDLRSSQCTDMATANLQSQIKYMKVNWHSANSNKRQVKALATFISRWLSIKENSWDIVLVGHSRGGIFAHDLSEKLKNVSKINSLHTVLLDPTSSSSVSDTYPSQLHKSSKFSNYGYFVYDNKGMIKGSKFDSTFGAFGDREIKGYETQLFSNSNHEEIPNDWIASSKFSDFIAHVQTIKDNQNTYLRDGPNVDEILVIRVNQSYADFSIGIENGNLIVDGEVVLTPGLSAYSNTSIGQDGVFLNQGASVLVVHYSVQTVITKDHVYLAANSTVANGVISISGSDGVYTSVNVLGVTGADISLNSSGFESNIVIGGTEIDIITTPSVSDFVNELDDIGNIPGYSELRDVVSDLGDDIGDGLKSVGDSIGDGLSDLDPF